MNHKNITVIGAGMAGSEAAFAAAELGIKVKLFEMRPQKMTPAHCTNKFAELVCSNSLGGKGKSNAKGFLQAEMLAAKGLIMKAAYKAALPAGGALAVDREYFSELITKAIFEHSNITVYNEEITEIPEGIVVIASGPLTSDTLAQSLQNLVGIEFLGFYDAAAPVITSESINLDIAYRKGRYNQEADYLNLPFNKEQYDKWFEVIAAARKHLPHEWEKLEFFEGCMPIEEIARRGYDTPRFGPLKPVGLEHPETGESFYAVAQLRQEDLKGQMWSLVGFQTGLKWGDQKEMVRSVPALEKADIVRYGVMHRNTYLNAPKLLAPEMNLKTKSNIFVAGVLAGTEGYLESAATGWLAGINAAKKALGLDLVVPPETSMLGGLARFLVSANPNNFQPMNANWGLVPAIKKQRGISKFERREQMYDIGISAFREWLLTLTK